MTQKLSLVAVATSTRASSSGALWSMLMPSASPSLLTGTSGTMAVRLLATFASTRPNKTLHSSLSRVQDTWSRPSNPRKPRPSSTHSSSSSRPLCNHRDEGGTLRNPNLLASQITGGQSTYHSSQSHRHGPRRSHWRRGHFYVALGRQRLPLHARVKEALPTIPKAAEGLDSKLKNPLAKVGHRLEPDAAPSKLHVLYAVLFD